MKLNELIPGKWYSQDSYWQKGSFGKFNKRVINEFIGTECYINKEYRNDLEFSWINEDNYQEVPLETLIEYLPVGYPDLLDHNIIVENNDYIIKFLNKLNIY